jgi:TolB protein
MRHHPLPTAVAVALALTLAACSSAHHSRSQSKPAAATATASAVPKRARGLPTGHLLYRRVFEGDESNAAIYALGPGETNGRATTNPPEGSFDDIATENPNGSRFAFTRCARRCTIWTASANGSDPKRLLPNCDSPPPECRDASEPVYSRDGRAIYYGGAWGREADDWIEHSDLFGIPARGGKPTRLTHLSAKGYQVDVNKPNVSPDGKRLVFEVIESSTAPHAGHRAVFTMNVDGSHQRRVTPWNLNAGDHPRFSPDGAMILFRSVPGDGAGGELYTMRPDGSHVMQLTRDTPGMLSADWSPDGKYIAYAREGANGDLGDIWIMNADGTNAAPLVVAPQWDSRPTWGP